VPNVFLPIAILGGITAAMAATLALVQFDIKRVLAYSTLSQLGYMFLALGAGGMLAVHDGSSAGYTAGIFHLMNHAFFKALLFLGAGSVILGMHHSNDMREMGGLHRKMPWTSWTVLIGTIAIAGIPPLSGFWSKDEILASLLEAGKINPVFLLLWVLGLGVAVLTALYMFRMWFMTFWGKPKSEKAEHAHESPASMTLPLVVLAIFALISGFFLFAGFADFIHFDAHEFLAGAPAAQHQTGPDLLNNILSSPYTYLSVLLALGGLAAAFSVYMMNRPAPDSLIAPIVGHDIHKVLTNLYYYDHAFMTAGEKVGMGLARAGNVFERNVIDGAVRGVGAASAATSTLTRRWQSGVVTTYALVVVCGLSLVLLFLFRGAF
jgi:NADH-quinone oxidoreductase subunit L